MKQLFSILFIVSLALQSQAQLSNDREVSRVGLIVSAGLLNTSLYNPTFYYYLCFEGCQADEQGWLTRPAFNAGITYGLNTNHQLMLLTGYSEYGFHEKGTSYFPTSTYELDRIWKFWGLEAGHLWNFAKTGRFNLFIGNSLRLETPFNGKEEPFDRVIKSFGTSYNGRFGTEFQLRPGVSLMASAIFKSSVFKYNKIEPVLDNNDYRPYAFGGEVGLKVKI